MSITFGVCRLRSAVLLCMLMPAALQAQPLSADQARRVDSVYRNFDRNDSPGCSVAIYRNGEIAYARGYGMANLELGVAIGPKTVFDIGSTSKQFAATAIVLLAQDGKLSLDDEVQKFIPELPKYQRPVTLRHLLNHTSGLRDYLTLMRLHGTDFDGRTGDRDALDLIVRQKAVNFEPGSEFLYSNSGFFLLSQVVKRVSGRTLPQFAQERIFTPLGMTSTHFHDDHTMIVPNRATGYAPKQGGGFTISMSLFEQTGDGAVMTTVEDLLKWDRNFYMPTVGGEALLRDLHTQGKLNNGQTITYALGLMIDQHRGLRRVAHGGAWAGYRAELVRFPEAKTSVASLCNLGTVNPTVLANAVAEIVLAERMAAAVASNAPRPAGPPPARRDTITIPAARVADYSGTYYAAEVDATYRVEPTQTALAIFVASEPEPIRLPATAPDTFGDARQLQVVFQRDNGGRVTGFTIDAGRVRGIVATKR